MTPPSETPTRFDPTRGARIVTLPFATPPETSILAPDASVTRPLVTVSLMPVPRNTLADVPLAEVACASSTAAPPIVRFLPRPAARRMLPPLAPDASIEPTAVRSPYVADSSTLRAVTLPTIMSPVRSVSACFC